MQPSRHLRVMGTIAHGSPPGTTHYLERRLSVRVWVEGGCSLHCPPPTRQVSQGLAAWVWARSDRHNMNLSFLPSSMHLFFNFYASLRCYNTSPGVLRPCKGLITQIDVSQRGWTLEIPIPPFFSFILKVKKKSALPPNGQTLFQQCFLTKFSYILLLKESLL